MSGAEGPDLAVLATLHDDIMAPWPLWAELRNILILAERHGRLPAGSTKQICDAVEAFGIGWDTTPAWAVVLDLARRHGLSVHAGLYLELARRQDASLASLDPDLRAATRADAVPVIG